MGKNNYFRSKQVVKNRCLAQAPQFQKCNKAVHSQTCCDFLFSVRSLVQSLKKIYNCSSVFAINLGREKQKKGSHFNSSLAVLKGEVRAKTFQLALFVYSMNISRRFYTLC